ncbi:MAG TPA: translation initiation factor IF-2 [Candidatus Saccharimonadales bacterium]|nr:translation initiation factor IF-2 [Candidatus Saccharimonadales bacterium]
MKIRINDLARELEVKSKAILDVLTDVGVTEKKTHSSSVEEDEAERLRKYFAAKSGSASSREKSVSTEIRQKIDLSKISKPGDVLRAIKEKEQQQHAPAPPARPAVAPPLAPTRPATVTAPPPQERPVAVPAKVMTPVASPVQEGPVIAPPPQVQTVAAPPAPPVPVEEVKAVPAPLPAVVVTLPPVTAPAAAVTTVVTPPKPPVVPASAPAAAQPPTATSAPKPQTQHPPQHPPVRATRMITPQTGPRPVYKAPPPVERPAPPPMPSRPPMQGSGTGRPMQAGPGGRPQGGVVRGQPIFSRRPGVGGGGPPGPPGSRPPYSSRPNEQRRGPHPTSGARPPYSPRPMGGGAVGPGMPPPPGAGKPAGRAGTPPRRPGQRGYTHGPKEGPMKGFTPPPRLSLSNEPLPITRKIIITEGISVKDLAEKLGIRAKDLIARLLMKGAMATVNQNLDVELAKDMARHFGAEVEVISFEDQAAKEMAEMTGLSEAAQAASVGTRPPVVTIMGHVDHGKTSLLDAIRETNVAGGEAGGITQHIGAYKVKITKEDSPAFGRQIVFLDTPGHEAFTRMRARGAKVTDIVVLVVAADDGVMPQTLEAMDHAKAAKVPIIVAVNKIDKPEALPDRVKKQLADRGLMPEDWGGTTVFVDVSAKKHTNLNLLMEMICLVADLQELKANPDRHASGTVVEAKIDRGRGSVATVLVQNGTLRIGDNFILGNTFGKVRAMFDDRGGPVDAAPPSTPVEVLGLEGLPQAGDQLLVVGEREKARQVSEYREQKAREATLAKSSKLSLEGLAEQIKSAGMKELPVILKTDVQGSAEVLEDTLTKLSNDKVKIKILHAGVGAITENDVLLASASNAVIIGFNVRPERKAQELAEQEKVDIRLHSIIYELQAEIKKAMVGLLEPIIKETYMGRAEVRDTFRVPKIGTIAGCYILDGTIKRDSDVRLLRDGVQVYKGKVTSLKRFKDDASEVRNGMECGIGISNFNDLKKGDVIESFMTERIAAEMGVA